MRSIATKQQRALTITARRQGDRIAVGEHSAASLPTTYSYASSFSGRVVTYRS